MAVDTRGSEIVDFYNNKNILITGATGFLGKIMVEQLLRKCNPKKIYLLIRSKKDLDPRQRLDEMFKFPVFDAMKKERPNFIDYLDVLEGDTSKPDLGLSSDSIAIITDKIEIVFHSAATVKFDEHIKQATSINVAGTKNLTILCHKIKHLKAFVHISTAFSNCPKYEIAEEFYESPISADNLIKLVDCLKDNKLTNITDMLLEKWPNTYSFTKAVAEDAVKTYAKGLPVAVLRPAIVTSTRNEPMPGWIDNLYGPTGFVVGIGAGLIRVVRADKEKNAEIVPADMAVHAILAAGYKTSLLGPTNDIPIYNFVPSPEKSVHWGYKIKKLLEYGHIMPPSKGVWYFTAILCKNMFLFQLLTLLLHLFPALLIDTFLLITNNKPRALKIYQKIHKFSAVITYFSLRSWNFRNNNIQALWSGLNKKDKELFDFDMSRIDWDSYFFSIVSGARMYLFKENPETIPYAKRRIFWLHLLHRTVQLVFISSTACLLWFSVSMITRLFT